MKATQDVPVCPRCQKSLTQRSPRNRIIERIASLLYVYPFRCQLCAHRFLAQQWGVRYEKQRLDLREYVRIPIRLSVKFMGQFEGHGTTVDLSLQGCCVLTEQCPPAGAVLWLALQGTDRLPTIEVQSALVVGVRKTPSIGIQFLHMAPVQYSQLQQVIGEQLRAHPEYLLQANPVGLSGP